MSKDEIEEIIKNYLANHLEIDINLDKYPASYYYENRENRETLEVKIKVSLDGKVIAQTSSSV